MEELFKQIKNNTFTTADAYRRLALWQHVLEHTFFQTSHESSIMNDYLRILDMVEQKSDQSAIREWGTVWLSLCTADSVHTIVSETRAYVASQPTLLLYVPVAFDENAATTLGKWCRKEHHPDLLLDIQVDPQVIGGCAFVQNDRYFDYSFSAQLAKQPEVWQEVFNSYAKS